MKNLMSFQLLLKVVKFQVIVLIRAIGQLVLLTTFKTSTLERLN